MDDEFSSLESADGGYHGGHLHHEQQRISSEPEVESTSGCDTVADRARELAIRENITVGEAYSRLTAEDEDKKE